MTLIIEVVVGYMLKVAKNDFNTEKFKKEFAAIRHGNYFQFFNLIGKEIDYIVTYDSGEISSSVIVKPGEDNFTALIKCKNSLIDFYQRVLAEYGNFEDENFQDEIFNKAALFEISLRFHANDKRMSEEEITLENLINSLNLTKTEKEILHQGRKFINYLKRPKKLKGDWNEVHLKFIDAHKKLLELEITII